MPGPTRGYTTPHRCATVDSSRRNQPPDRDRQARRKLQEKASDFQVTFHDNIYLSLGPEAKQDIYNTFDPNRPFDIHLYPPSTECPPLVEIKQEGKPPVYTTDFILPINCPLILPSDPRVQIIILPTWIKWKQQTPHFLTQILYSQERFDYIRGCYIHHKHLSWLNQKTYKD